MPTPCSGYQAYAREGACGGRQRVTAEYINPHEPVGVESRAFYPVPAKKVLVLNRAEVIQLWSVTSESDNGPPGASLLKPFGLGR